MDDLGAKGLSQRKPAGDVKGGGGGRRRWRRRKEVAEEAEEEEEEGEKGVIKCNKFYDCVYASNNTARWFYSLAVLRFERR